jgi:hypothetical protein
MWTWIRWVVWRGAVVCPVIDHTAQRGVRLMKPRWCRSRCSSVHYRHHQHPLAPRPPPTDHPPTPPPCAQALRTCPVCRTTTHFITPSTAWPESPEDKEEIIATYKSKMGAIDCMWVALAHTRAWCLFLRRVTFIFRDDMRMVDGLTVPCTM